MVAMYHSVYQDEGTSCLDPRWSMPAHRFRAQMQQVRRWWRPIALSEAADRLARSERLPPRSICITFDDGYLDNLHVAAPILAELGIPATVFVATGAVHRGEAQPVDRLRFLLASARPGRAEIDIGLDNRILVDTTTIDHLARTFASLDTMATRLDRASRESIFQALAEQFGGTDLSGATLTLSPDDARELVDRFPLIQLGAHSVDHLDLTSLDGLGVEREIRQSISDLQSWSGTQIRAFSCPYNRSNELVRCTLAKHGIRVATGPGNSQRLANADQLLEIPRFDPALPGPL